MCFYLLKCKHKTHHFTLHQICVAAAVCKWIIIKMPFNSGEQLCHVLLVIRYNENLYLIQKMRTKNKNTK